MNVNGKCQFKDKKMSLFKANYKDKYGKLKVSKKWYIDFRDHKGRRHKIAGYTSKKDTAALERQIEALIACRGSNSEISLELHRWLDGLSDSLLKKLVKWGLVQGQKVNSGKPLSVQLKDWKQSLITDGSTEQYINQIYNRVTSIFRQAGFLFWSDVSHSKLKNEIGKLKRTVRAKDGDGNFYDKIIGPARDSTRNSYLKACKQFTNWMIEDGRAITDPLKAKSDKRKRSAKKIKAEKRAALELEELRTLFDYTKNAGRSFGLNGYQRYLLYLFASETGYRAGEIRSLRVCDFDFANNIARLSGDFTKNDYDAEIPLKQSTMEIIKDSFSGKMPTAPAFKLCSKSNMARMFRKDLKDAGIEIDPDRGEVVFHSLRHTTASLMANSDIHPKKAQAIMRHSDINLTMTRYTHQYIGQLTEAVNQLPDLNQKPKDQQRATGTNDHGEKQDAIGEKILYPYLDKNLAKHSNSLQNHAKSETVNDAQKKPITGDNRCLSASDRMKVLGLEPKTYALKGRCSTN